MRVFVSLVFLCLSLSPSSPARLQGLYTDQDQVTILDDTNFYPTLEGKEHAWLVEFYASWCGHCQNLAPIFKQLAQRMQGWGALLKVAVIDCGDEVNNNQICNQGFVRGFPTIRFFAPNMERSDKGLVHIQPNNQSIWQENMTRASIDFLEKLISQAGKDGSGGQWPRLQPINRNVSSLTVKDLWPQGNQQTFLVVEKPHSYLGREVIVNTWRRDGQHPVVRRIVSNNDDNQMSTLSSLGITSLPSLLLMESESQEVTAIPIQDTQDTGDTLKAFLRAIRDREAQDRLRDPTNFRPRPSSTRPSSLDHTTTTLGHRVGREEVERRRYSVFLSDLEKTVMYALQNEVAIKKQIPREPLKQFLQVLILYLPGSSSLVPSLRQLSQQLHQKELVTDEALKSSLGGIPFTPTENWEGCRGSKPRYGGYPCGLWQLWHSLTIAQRAEHQGFGSSLLAPQSAANSNITNNLPGGSIGSQLQDPRMVLRAMVTYVREFFGCRKCAQHFLEMVKNGTAVEDEVNSTDDAVLFLWAAHNKVNLRLIEEKSVSNDPVFPKFRFPEASFCPSCWDVSRGSPGDPVEGPTLTFLHSLYFGAPGDPPREPLALETTPLALGPPTPEPNSAPIFNQHSAVLITILCLYGYHY